MTAPVPVPHFLLEKQMFDQDPCPDQDQDDPAQDAGVFLQQGTQLAAEIDRRKAEHEGRYPDDRDAGQDVHLQKSKGDADGECVDAGRYGQKQDVRQSEIAVRIILIFTADRLTDHVAADEGEQDEGDPVIDGRNQRFEQ